MRTNVLILAILFAYSAFANVYYVATTGDDTAGDGSAFNAWRTIKCAVDNAATAEGDEIRIQAGLYEESVTNDVVNADGKHGLIFSGGWGADWVRNLATNRTIVRPPAGFVKTLPCFFVRASTNKFIGIDFTGGSSGIYVSSTRWGVNNDAVIHHEVSQCVFTNNVTALETLWQGFAVGASLIAENSSYGFYHYSDHGTQSYLNNCTFAGNSVNDIYLWTYPIFYHPDSNRGSSICGKGSLAPQPCSLSGHVPKRRKSVAMPSAMA